MPIPETGPRPGLAAIDRALAEGDMAAVKRALFGLDDDERRILEAQMGPDALARSYRSARGRRRGAGLGRVVVLPGLMGTQLDSVDAGGDADRIWVNFFRITLGRMDELRLGLDGLPLPPPHTVKVSGLYKEYLPLLLALDEHWEVRPFGYDWRRDVDLAAQALADDIRTWARGEPAHLLVHSMGGLVARRFVQLFPDVWASMADPERRGRGGRLVMLGTPNRGSFAIPGAMTGEEDVVKKLGLLDATRGVTGLLPILNTFLGSYQTMPSPQVDLGDDHRKLFQAGSWGAFPVSQALLDGGARFQKALHPVIDPERLVYVAGYDQDTPCAIKIASPGRFEYRQTKDGDGRVTHELGLLKGVRTLFVKARHGDLSKDARVLGGIHDLLSKGETSQLESSLPGGRGARATGSWAPFPVAPVPPEVAALAAALRTARRSSRVTVALEVQAARLEALVVSEALGTPSSPFATEARSSAKTKAAGHPSLRVEVVWGDITKVEGDVYAVGHYHGVPPQNAVSALDAALSAGSEHRLLADHVRRGLIRGELGTVSFFPWGRRTIAIAGMGFPGTFGEGQLRALARSLTWAVSNVPGARTICSVLIGSGEGNLGVADSVMGMFHGMAEALAEGAVKTRVSTLRLVERRRDRAFEIQGALAAVKARLSDQIDLVVASRVKTGPAGVIGPGEAASLVVGAAVQALGKGASAAQRRRVAALLKDHPRAVAAGPGLTRALERLAGPSGPPAVDVGRGPDPRIPTRISFSGDPLPYRVAAITNTTTVAERPISIDQSLVTDLVERMTDAEPFAAASLSDLLRRLLVPGEFEDLLKGAGAYVFEVDRPMARLHWEMLAAFEGARAPLSVTNPLARQLRTVYSAPPSPTVRLGQKRTALVIGDPGDPNRGQSLPGARREAIRVVEILTAHDVLVTARIGAPGDAAIPSGFEPADRLDCLHLLMKGGFDILHYAGHGDFDPERPDRVGWVFKSGLLTARELQRLSVPPRLVVANACLSALTSFLRKDEAALLPSLADEFFRRGVRDYVGTAWEVNDQGAVLFMEKFYGSLLAPTAGTLGQAVLDARKALWDERNVYGSLWAAYQHYGDPLARIGGDEDALAEAPRAKGRRKPRRRPKR